MNDIGLLIEDLSKLQLILDRLNNSLAVFGKCFLPLQYYVGSKQNLVLPVDDFMEMDVSNNLGSCIALDG